jgi:uncharacterized protein YbjT (DUF2867 family)
VAKKCRRDRIYARIFARGTSIINDGGFYLALADVRLNPVDLVDVGKIGFLLLRDGGHEGERIPITGPEALSMAEIADRISRATTGWALL